MEITRDNFKAALPGLLKDIEESDFVSFDFEFTGLLASPARTASAVDTPRLRYAATRHSAKHFSVVQIGLCMFKRIKTTGGGQPETTTEGLLSRNGQALCSGNRRGGKDGEGGEDCEI